MVVTFTYFFFLLDKLSLLNKRFVTDYDYKIEQCTPFLSTQQLKEFFKLVEKSLLIVSSVHIMEQKFASFNSTSKDTFAFTSL